MTPGLSSEQTEFTHAARMSEPDAGSAIIEFNTAAREYDDDYIINGSKVFSTHSGHAELFLIYVRFRPGINGVGSVPVERGTPGFTLGNA